MAISMTSFEQSVGPIFPGPFRFISDSPGLVSFLQEEGMEAHSLNFGELQPLAEAGELENVVVIVTTKMGLPTYQTWTELLGNSRVLMLPLFSFDGSLEAAMYSLQRLSESDLAQGARSNYEWLTRISEAVDPFVLQGNGTQFTCEWEDEVHLMAPKIEPLMEPGDLVAVTNYIETGVLTQADDITPSYDVNGTFLVPGVAVAHHRQMADSLVPLTQEAWNLFAHLHHQGGFPLRIDVEHSRVVNAMAGKRSIFNELLRFSNPSYELVLTEMAFGTNTGFTADEIDWTYNSQLNEGAAGIHIGLGEGLTGAHIDLICPGVELV